MFFLSCLRPLFITSSSLKFELDSNLIATFLDSLPYSLFSTTSSILISVLDNSKLDNIIRDSIITSKSSSIVFLSRILYSLILVDLNI